MPKYATRFEIYESKPAFPGRQILSRAASHADEFDNYVFKKTDERKDAGARSFMQFKKAKLSRVRLNKLPT